MNICKALHKYEKIQTMDYTYSTIGQWYKHIVAISKERFGKDVSNITSEELKEASEIIKDFNNEKTH